jgi:hypothetical protein
MKKRAAASITVFILCLILASCTRPAITVDVRRHKVAKLIIPCDFHILQTFPEIHVPRFEGVTLFADVIFPNITIVVQSLEESSRIIKINSDANGRFALSDLAEGAYRVQLCPPSGFDTQVGFVVVFRYAPPEQLVFRLTLSM